MAKASKKTAVADQSSTDDIFSILIGQHNKRSNGIATLGSQMESEIKHYIDSGSMLLNMILSNKENGGWPGGRIVEVYGPESIGKSTLSYVAMANCQKQGGIPIYADIERTGNKEFMKLFGIDLNKLITTNEETIEKLFEALEDNLTTLYNMKRTNCANLIVVDSVTSLQTDSELEGGYEYNMNVALAKAKMMGKALKKIIPFLSKTNTCLYLVNQVRENVSGYGDKWVVPGGKSIPFYASIRLQLSGKEKIEGRDRDAEQQYQDALALYKTLTKDEKDKMGKPERDKKSTVTLGYTVTAYTKKNKTAPPDRTAEFDIEFAKGVSDESNYLKYCEQYGWLKKTGARYQFANKDMFALCEKTFYKTEWLNVLTSSEELYKLIYDKLADKLTVRIGNSKFSEDKVDSEEDYKMEVASAPIEDLEEDY